MSEHQEPQKAGNTSQQQASRIQQESKKGNTSSAKVASFTPEETSLSKTFARLGKNPPDDGFSKVRQLMKNPPDDGFSQSREAIKNYNAHNAARPISERFSSVVPTTSQNAIQRMEDSSIKKKKEEEKIQMKKGEQAQTSGGSASSGTMPEGVKEKMESSFGVDFSEVKIHDNSAKSTDMGAKAYAQGSDIHFAPGEYNPETQAGQELLGHELTHVVQQREGRVQATTQAKGVAVNDDPALEREADEKGKKAAQMKNSVKEKTVQRKEEKKQQQSVAKKIVQRQAGNPDYLLDDSGYVTRAGFVAMLMKERKGIPHPENAKLAIDSANKESPGLIQGDNNADPYSRKEKALNRIEAATIMNRFLNITGADYKYKVVPFKDVTESSWIYEPAHISRLHGIFIGTDENEFLPDDYMYQDIAEKPIKRASANKEHSKDEQTKNIEVKESYPQTGIVIDTGSTLALREGSGLSSTILADLPDGTLVTVNDNSEDWMSVSVDTSQSGVVLNEKGRAKLNGNILVGFSYHEFIASNAVAHEMSNMLGKEAEWAPSGPSGGKGNDFERWASASSEGVAPPLNSSTTINCWEMILLAAYRTKAISWKWIHDLYTNTTGNWGRELPNRMTKGTTTAYDANKTPSIPKGHLVFFGGANHVTLAVGKADMVYTFWPPPDGSFAKGIVDEIKISTVRELANYMEGMGPKYEVPKVTMGLPIW